MDAIIQNAQRLLSDAQLLFDHGRYPTSAALAILSIEEIGKTILGMSVQHKSKQKAATAHDWAHAILDGIDKCGYKIARIEENVFVAEDDYSLLIKLVSDFLFTSELLSHVSKRLSTVKNSGFYVDVSPDDTILSEPSCIDSVTAKRAIEMASKFLHRYSRTPASA